MRVPEAKICREFVGIPVSHDLSGMDTSVLVGRTRAIRSNHAILGRVIVLLYLLQYSLSILRANRTKKNTNSDGEMDVGRCERKTEASESKRPGCTA